MISAEARCAPQDLSTRLRPFVARRVPPADVDDVLQDVFLRVQRGLGGLRDDDRFGPWLYRVARSAIAEQRRARRRHPLHAEEGRPEPMVDDDEENEAELRLVHCVIPFVAMLPTPYREALTLTELEGVSQKRAAEMVGISVTGMRSRVQRGRAQLRQLLETCCEIALDARGGVVSCEPRRPAGCSCEPPK